MRGPMGEWSAERILLVDLSDGEPTEFAERGVRARQAARILGVDRLSLGLQDRLVLDTPEVRLAVARLIRKHRSRWVYGTGEACFHPDHAAAASRVDLQAISGRTRVGLGGPSGSSGFGIPIRTSRG